MITTSSVLLSIFLLTISLSAQKNDKVYPGADEVTPSLSQYFSWINNTNEGSTEAQTLINLDFFNWLHEETEGKQLDIFVLGMKGGKTNFKPRAYLGCYPVPYQKKELILYH